MCLASSEPASATTSGGAEQTKMPGVWNYRTMSPCMVEKPIYNPLLCTQTYSGSATGVETECNLEPWKFMMTGWPTTANFGGIIGLARDGHVIVGPYN